MYTVVLTTNYNCDPITYNKIVSIRQNKYVYSGDELLTHPFIIGIDLNLFTENKQCVISTKDLVSIEITKE